MGVSSTEEAGKLLKIKKIKARQQLQLELIGCCYGHVTARRRRPREPLI